MAKGNGICNKEVCSYYSSSPVYIEPCVLNHPWMPTPMGLVLLEYLCRRIQKQKAVPSIGLGENHARANSGLLEYRPGGPATRMMVEGPNNSK